MMHEWWQFALLWTGCCTVGSGIGYIAARAFYGRRRRDGRMNGRYVRPRCLRDGHDWLRLEGVPFQFCHRWRCDGARVAPDFAAVAPPELVAEMELVIDQQGDALSQDRRP